MIAPKSVFLTAFLAVFLCLVGASEALATCFERTEFASNLKNQHAERPVSMGLANTGAMVEIFASPKGTFTILLTQPDGTSCFVAAGEYWENLTDKKKGKGI